MKPFDVFLPTFNSQKLLPTVLPRIEKVIPTSAIHNKFIIDDFSTDKTCEVAEKLGWKAFPNKVKGSKFAQEYGFSLVETECAAIFEHDIFLAENWYPTIPNLVYSGQYDVAQGIRVINVQGFREIDLYDYNHRVIYSEDNVFYSMDENGLPKIRNPQSRRCIRYDVCSIHLRKSIIDCLQHYYFIYKAPNIMSLSSLLKCLLHSPILPIKIFREPKGSSVLLIYPLERLFMFAGGLVMEKPRGQK